MNEHARPTQFRLSAFVFGVPLAVCLMCMAGVSLYRHREFFFRHADDFFTLLLPIGGLTVPLFPILGGWAGAAVASRLQGKQPRAKIDAIIVGALLGFAAVFLTTGLLLTAWNWLLEPY